MSGWRQFSTVMALFLSMFLTSLDLSQRRRLVRFGLFLTISVFQTVWGKLYQHGSLKYTFLLAILIFELGVLACAVSRNSPEFVAGRAVAGLGGAGVIGRTYVILAHLVALEKIPIFYGLNGIIFTLASVAGPRTFYINLPIGGVVMVILLHALRLPSTALCYLLALREGGIMQPWSSSQPIGLLVGWLVLTLAFALVEWCQGEHALVASHHLRNHGVWSCYLFVVRVYRAYLSVFTLPAGGVLGKPGYYQPFLVLGAAIVPIGSGLIWTLGPTSSTAKSAGYQVLTGISDGICVQVPVTAVQAFVELQDLPTVTVLVVFPLGSGVISVTASESIFSNKLLQSLLHYAPGVSGDEALGVGAAQLEEFFGGDTLWGVREAHLVGIKDAWILTLAFCGAAFVVACIAPPVSIWGRRELHVEKRRIEKLRRSQSKVIDAAPSKASADSQLQGDLTAHSKHSYSNKHLPGASPPDHASQGGKFLRITDERGKGKRKKQTDEKKPKFLIKRRAFSRVVREIANEATSSSQIRFQPGAIEALQTVAEEMLVTEFTLARLTIAHSKRETLKKKDMKFVQKIRRILDGSEMSPEDDVHDN
ncbi:putative efflux pump antibiotic resistance protein [Aspergillus terreus]|uniref:Histone H3 n=1 Tax=Aspergillus terreus TaxID=33178 RepID=A0A5M3YQI0_ASPTE|nr:hypothetical protein ATETN484_0002094500 [Aspergillus terreus]GFF15801.1 putative efflux pump antibiotic resistance protein [Aspergillus terreus]